MGVEGEYEFLECMWPVFLIGKILGLFHLRRSGSTKLVHFYKSPIIILTTSILWITHLIMVIFAIIILVRGLRSKDTELVQQLQDLVYHLHIFMIFNYGIKQSKNVPDLFEHWFSLEHKLNRLETLVDFDCCKERGKNWGKLSKLTRIIPFIHPRTPAFSLAGIKIKIKGVLNGISFVKISQTVIGTYFFIAVSGAITYFRAEAYRVGADTFSVYLESTASEYVLEEYSTWWVGAYLLFCGHYMEVTWAYGDMVIFMFSFVIIHRYKRFNRVLEIVSKYNPSVLELEHLRTTHWDIAIGIKKVDVFMGFLTGTQFVGNILYLFTRVYVGLAEDFTSPNPFLVFEATFAFSELIGRILLSAYIAASLHEEANRTLAILMQFKEENYKETDYLVLDRFCNQVITGRVGFTGSGYFVLNSNFIVSLISAFATYEIIIIQFSNSSRSAEKPIQPQYDNQSIEI